MCIRDSYQPIHASVGHGVVAFEALLRWDHPERGSLPPLDFIPMAEESGQMVSIGAWVIGEACRQAVQWRNTFGVDTTMAVNVSEWQLADPSFVDIVSDALHRTTMRPEQLVLEITEGILLHGRVDFGSVLSDLKLLGVRLSVDDFGAGYSSLAYLQQLPIDQIKVDRGFMLESIAHGDRRVMESIIRLAHDLGLEVVAEGVETQVEFEAMQASGCDVVQGFLLGRPTSATHTEHRIREDGLHPASDNTDRTFPVDHPSRTSRISSAPEIRVVG